MPLCDHSDARVSVNVNVVATIGQKIGQKICIRIGLCSTSSVEDKAVLAHGNASKIERGLYELATDIQPPSITIP